ncbi:hypothetical protein BCV70DRAFT_50907 [Testicularia cyperi]|uniref:Secreted protein n=1 Tax=Testicularia cyperi TaxID=1882483 RepID=A0A317XI95_9BASI|nr:hypothetical protein BCV70DRAFT_50907 [Testicularia cyperi]
MTRPRSPKFCLFIVVNFILASAGAEAPFGCVFACCAFGGEINDRFLVSQEICRRAGKGAWHAATTTKEKKNK